MQEKPKSVWTKPLWLPGSFAGWLVAGAAAGFLVSLAVLTAINAQGWTRDWPLLFVGSFVGALTVSLYFSVRWLCRPRNLGRFLFGLACVATLMALFYAEEDWRGWHTWNQFKQAWEAKGEHFDMAGITPAPVPADQNFALTPIAFTSYGQLLTREGTEIPSAQRDPNFAARMNIQLGVDVNGPTNQGNWAMATFVNLKSWQQAYREWAATTNEFAVPALPGAPAADVLLALSKYDGVIDELRTASRLPQSRFPLSYDNESPAAILLPHLAALKGCSLVLRLRAVAELQNGQPDQALNDTCLGLQLAGKIQTEPFLISHLVRIAMLQLMLQPVWEGLAEHRWSDAQLVALDGELAKFDFFAAYQFSVRGELGLQGGEITRLRRHPAELGDFGGYSDDDGISYSLNPGPVIAQAIPRGWFYQNQYRCARVMEEYYLPVADAEHRTFSPDLAQRGDRAVHAETKSLNAYNLLERMLLPSLANAAVKFSHAQASVDLARTAVALERYRLAHGEYPESPDALVLQFLAAVPHDVIGGQPLKYRREADGRFVLYSVGWNETDDGGKVVVGKGAAPMPDYRAGDWVWQYPAK